jgi:hypothetical protein
MRAAEELRYLILALQREGNRLLAAGLRPLGLTPSQAEVLRVLAERQPLTLSALGQLVVGHSATAEPVAASRAQRDGRAGGGQQLLSPVEQAHQLGSGQRVVGLAALGAIVD